MKRKNDDMLIDFRDQSDRWQACLSALNTDYTLSIKQACQTLKCSRAWLQKYVRPFVHYIYLSNAMSDGKRNIRGIDYVQLARKTLGRDDIKESTWLHRSEFEALIRDNMTFTRQIISVPIELFVEKDNIPAFQLSYRNLEGELKKIFKKEKVDWEEIKIAQEKLNDLLEKSWDRVSCECIKVAPNPYKRSATKAVPCQPTQVFELDDMVAVYDIKGYGDTDEEIYRRLFSDGYYRIQIDMPMPNNLNEIATTKIYYLKPDKAEKQLLLRALDIEDSVKWVPMAFEIFDDFMHKKGLPMLQ